MAVDIFDIPESSNKEQALLLVRKAIQQLGYKSVEANETKPWGAYYRFLSSESRRFVAQFFEDISYADACLGREDIELSPKFLVVSPNQRLSWQYHKRRAERWHFLTTGSYYKSNTDELGELHIAKAGSIVQFDTSERHRLCANNGYTIVAEIWQHTDPSRESSEEDIVRVSDDYSRR